MKGAPFALAVALSCRVMHPAQAHRLDEYLEATTIALHRDHVAVELRLTPGISVATGVLQRIDRNGDGVLSAAEQEAYAREVAAALSLSVDGRPTPMRLRGLDFPQPAHMLDGTGDISLRFDAVLPPLQAGTHRLAFDNHHAGSIAVYLVNALVPHDPGLRILDQQRSNDQSRYALGFETGAAGIAPLPAAPEPIAADLAMVRSFFGHGVHHILTGYDHLLFVAALVLAATTLWDLVTVVTAFTVAHSLTLCLSALGLVHLPSSVVEPLISGSIVFVAVQTLVRGERRGARGRLAAAFLFGLVHGLGFAGGLLALMHGMATATILLAILGFSLGIEAGNQLVLLPLFGALRLVPRVRADPNAGAALSRAVRRLGSAAIAVAGVCYLGLALTGKG